MCGQHCGERLDRSPGSSASGCRTAKRRGGNGVARRSPTKTPGGEAGLRAWLVVACDRSHWIKPGTHVSSVGYHPPAGELPVALARNERLSAREARPREWHDGLGESLSQRGFYLETAVLRPQRHSFGL